ncbi:hypothetical protein MMC17_001064 [Xylographa soralifera]|nr:hypothetical protein [Xylographa soralifera]
MLGLSLAIRKYDYTWSYKPVPQATSVPPTPRPTPYLVRRFWGYVHKLLVKFSYHYYCRWNGKQFLGQIHQLPFGLILKWSDGTRLEEALTMQVARAADLPVPRVICYGEHPDTPHAPVSILMTRMPGQVLFEELWDWYLPEQKATIISELKIYLDAIRSWPSPWLPPTRICAISGGSIRSIRVPNKQVGPCQEEKDFNKHLLEPAWRNPNRSLEWYNKQTAQAAELHSKSHRIVFTHGDLTPWNILVHEGHVTAILDWEAAGWYPEYWEFTTAWRYTPTGNWWYEIVKELTGGRYLEERVGDLAVRTLTSDAITGW